MSDYDSNATSGAGVPEEPVPVVGAVSLIGRRSSMEDAVSIWPNLCSPYLNRHRSIDFFAVYDGLGGPNIAGLCRDRMYLVLLEELMMTRTIISDSSSKDNTSTQRQAQLVKEMWKRLLKRCFQRIDEMSIDTCYECGIGIPCGCPPHNLGLGGSTAVLAILTEKTIIVANCGNSRAVLSRGGRTIPLSIDHKPDRLDERARIEACGGRVDFDDCARVEGILAISRAIGVKYLKKYIIYEPEFTFTKRELEDECLIVATDGLWGIVPSEMACQVARECLRQKNPVGYHGLRPLFDDDCIGEVFSSPSEAAATLLTRLAMERGNKDNISVIVIDLKTNNI